MIGQLTFEHDGTRVTATLDDDLRWGDADAGVLDRLDGAFYAEPVPGLPNLLIGRHLLYQAAARLDGAVTLPTLPRREPEAMPA